MLQRAGELVRHGSLNAVFKALRKQTVRVTSFARRTIVLALIISWCSVAYSQIVEVEDVANLEKLKRGLLNKAERSFTEGKYTYALQYYLELYNLDTTNVEYCYAIGVSYINAGGPTDKTKALYYLTKYPQVLTVDLDAHYYVGLAYQYDHEFNKAKAAFESYIQAIEFDVAAKISDMRNDNIRIKEAQRRIEMCEFGQHLMDNQLNVELENLGEDINSPYSDYTPVISADESVLIFTSRRKGSTGDKIDDYNEFYEDIYISFNDDGYGWSRAMKIDSMSFMGPVDDVEEDMKRGHHHINTNTQDAAIGLSADGQKLFIYRSDEQRWGNIYMCTLEGNEWSKPKKLGSNINSKHWEGHASLAGDENSLYFSSNRPGGYGGKDIYMARRIPGGDWGEPINLGPAINTKEDEDAPFIHPDGKTIYFSSKGHKGMGSYDIFKSKLKADGFWEDPENIGYPINTADDDIYFVLSANGERGYFSSIRDGGVGAQDLYSVTMPEYYNKNTVLTLMKGIVKACEDPIEAIVTVIDNTTGKTQGQYKSNAITGKYVIAIPSGADYSIRIESDGYFFQTESVFFPAQDSFIQINKDIDLLCGELGDRICMNNIFFPVGKAKLLPQSLQELDNLYKFMENNPNLILQVKAYILTDFGYLDESVARKRAETVIEYLVSMGIEPTRLIAVGEALDSLSYNLDLNNRICVEMVGGRLGKGGASVRAAEVTDEVYQEVLLHCGDRPIPKLKYRIQIGAFRDAGDVDFHFLSSNTKIRREILEDGITRFTMGAFDLLKEADDVRKAVVNEGISDAWVVPYYKHKRVGIDEVKALCKSNVIVVVNGVVMKKENNRPMFNAKVIMRNLTTRTKKETFTGPDGTFQFVLSPDMKYRIVALKPDYLPDTIPITTEGMTQSESVNLTLELEKDILPFGGKRLREMYLKGRVVNAETGQEVKGAKVQLVNLFTDDLEQVENFESGSFDFKTDEATNFSLRVLKEGFFNKSVEISTFSSVRDTMTITVELVPLELEKSFELEVIYFESNRWALQPAAAAELDKVVLLLDENPRIIIELGSHTDSRGADDYNLQLSNRRAKTAVKYIVSQGISPDRIKAKGYGETKLVNHCANEIECSDEEHAKNRRVEFKVVGFVRTEGTENE